MDHFILLEQHYGINKGLKKVKKVERMGIKKGFLLTLISIIFLLIFYSYYVKILRMKVERNSENLKLLLIDKINYYVDDIVDDLRNLIEINNDENLTIVENLSINKTKFFADYINFISNYSNLGVKINISYFDPIKVNYFGANYYSYFNGTIIFINDSSPGSSLPFSYYEINIKVNESYVSYIPWDWKVTGTYVKINYSSPTNISIFEGYVDPALENDFVFICPSGNITIRVGRISTYRNSFAIYQSGKIKYLKLVTYPNEKYADLYFNIIANVTILDEKFVGFLPVK